MTANSSNIAGDNNIVLQDINARDITINIAKDLPPEVKQQKELLTGKIKNLVERLTAIHDKAALADQPEPFTPPDDNPAYDAIRWRRLMQALRHQGCVLFIGPEISVNSSGKSLHQEFYKELDEDFDEIEYLEDEGYFSPESDEVILYDIIEFYSKEFPKKNKAGRKILEELARVPFSLIISITPDDTMHKVMEHYNLDHQFLAFDGTKQEAEPITPEKPLVYNILGNAANNGRYIFTHENFYNFINKVVIPSEIKKKIQEATHYLFIGFDFDKWYNRLLLFILDFDQKKSGAHRITIGKKTVKKEIENFISKQFKITFVENDYSQFAQWLLYNAGEATDEGKLLKDLNRHFVQANFGKLKLLSAEVSSEDDLQSLQQMEATAKAIENAVGAFEQKINTPS
jgi:hypothetical protein